MPRAGVGGQDQEPIFAREANAGDHDRQFRSVPDLVGKPLCGQPEGLDVRQIGAADARPPEHQVADDGGELLPLPIGTSGAAAASSMQYFRKTPRAGTKSCKTVPETTLVAIQP